MTNLLALVPLQSSRTYNHLFDTSKFIKVVQVKNTGNVLKWPTAHTQSLSKSNTLCLSSLCIHLHGCLTLCPTATAILCLHTDAIILLNSTLPIWSMFNTSTPHAYKSDMPRTQNPEGIPSFGIRHIDPPSTVEGLSRVQFPLLSVPSWYFHSLPYQASYVPLIYELIFFIFLDAIHPVPFSSFLRYCDVQILPILQLKSKTHSLILGDFLSINNLCTLFIFFRLLHK